MTIAEYRKQKKLKQTELAEELKKVCPGIDAALISKMEHGLCCPNSKIQAYLDSTSEASQDDLQVCSESFSDGPWVIYPPASEKTLKTEIQSTLHDTLYQLISNASSKEPASREFLSKALDLNDRDIRLMIQELRNLGCWICSSSSSKGYWICENDQQKSELLRSYHSRRVSLEFTEWALTHLKDPYQK